MECNMGAAGDMLAAALFELLERDDAENFLNELNRTVPEGVSAHCLSVSKSGLTGTRFEVSVNGAPESSGDDDFGHIHDGHGHDHDHEHHDGHSHPHSHHQERNSGSMADIEQMISGLEVSSRVRGDILAVYRMIADAESRVHGKPAAQVHFHEIGALDAVADITAVCMLMEKLSPDHIAVSPVHVGSGMVRCAHGLLPVPAPATALILRDVPVYGGNIRGELCTPTGAALLRYFADSFGPMPAMTYSRIGIGMGKKDYEAANCVRVFLGGDGETADTPNGRIIELSCNVDDMTGEAAGFASEIMLREGALDFFCVPVFMKKNRPGFMFVCLCDENDAGRMAALMLRHTTSFGVRKKLCERYTLDRTTTEKDTQYGKIRIKQGVGYGTGKSKPEYEDLKAAAEKNNLSISEVYSGNE